MGHSITLGKKRAWMPKPYVVIGAGLAGLTCAKRLTDKGFPVLILESDSRIGGRLKTDIIDGFTIDHGFQVYFDAYPFAGNILDHSALRLAKFEPGAMIHHEGVWKEVHKTHPLGMAFDPMFTWGDKLKLFPFSNMLSKMSEKGLWELDDRSAIPWLRAEGFSEKFIENFIKPFFQGIFLDRNVDVTAAMLAKVWRMLYRGNTCIPRQGIAAIPHQIAESIPVDAFRLHSPVSTLTRDGGLVRSVQTSSGESIEVEAVIVATDAASAARITQRTIPHAFRSCTTAYFSSTELPTDSKLLHVSTDPKLQTIHACVLSNVAEQLAPANKHLIQATVLGADNTNPRYLANAIKYEMAGWFGQKNVSNWRTVAVKSIAQAQLVQKAGFSKRRISNAQDSENLFFAGEFCTYGSIDGAVKAGEDCAAAILRLNGATQ